jgi:AcrR family transcriptional regulator
MGETRSISERLARMPPGRHLLPADFVARNQRERLLLATALLVSERGYQKTTIEAIAKTARVALATFYENFANKEECFLAAFDQNVEVAEDLLREVIDPRQPWPQRVAEAARAVLDLVAAEPAGARLCLVEAAGAGSAGLQRYQGMLERVAEKLREGRQLHPAGDTLPEGLELATAGGLAWLLYQRLNRGEEDQLSALLPEMVQIALGPYVGREEAAARAASAAADGSTSEAPGEAEAG